MTELTRPTLFTQGFTDLEKTYSPSTRRPEPLRPLLLG